MTKKAQKKGLKVTMTIRSEKEKNFVYKLSNGSTLEFPNKDFPISYPKVENNGQLLIF